MKILRKLSEEKGSITMTVVAAMLFITSAILIAYFSLSNQSNDQGKKTRQIADSYKVTNSDLVQKYKDVQDDLNKIKTISITGVKSLDNVMLGKETNTVVQDELENNFIVPAGFKVTNDADNVTEGIVIQDKQGNEFVWIPVGEVRYEYNGIKKIKTIDLGRYVFNSDGTINTEQSQTDPQGHLKVISTNVKYYTECLKNDDLIDVNGNAIAKDIEQFIEKTKEANGFYIGRYEARKETVNGTDIVVEKKNNEIYNNIKQSEAAILARNMYVSNNMIESDLINSFAWDTAILFLQEFGKENYSNEGSFNSASTGLESTGTIEHQCNVYDMASNAYEWSTETFGHASYPCVFRGGSFRNQNLTSNNRAYESIDMLESFITFRPILYIK